MFKPHCRTGVLFAWALIAVLGTVGCGWSDDSGDQTGGKQAGNSDSSTELATREQEEGYFGLSLDEDFYVYPPGDQAPSGTTWTSDGDVITCTGDPRGYIYSQEEFGNFTLRFDYRFPASENPEDEKKLNTGVLVYMSEENKLWPVSLEVQGKHVEMASIKANGGAADIEISDDEQARKQARKQPGEWNSMEIVSNDGALTASLNGTLICKSQPGELKLGSIGFQSEGAEVHFRNLRILVPDSDENSEESSEESSNSE